MRWSAVLCAPVAAVVAGCAHTVAGAVVFNPAEPITPLLRAGTPVRSCSVFLRYPTSSAAGCRPMPTAPGRLPASAAPACSALDAVGMSAFVGDGWSGIRVLLFTDGDRHDRVVSEAVAVYPDAGSAADVAPRRAPPGSGLVTDSGAEHRQRSGVEVQCGRGQFRHGAVDQTADRHPDDVICHGEARLRNNAVLQAMACQGDDGARPQTVTLTDRMSASVWELSGR